MVTVCAGAPDDISALGLAYGDYTLMPLWIWLYCIVWWFIQDTFKVGWALFLEGGGGHRVMLPYLFLWYWIVIMAVSVSDVILLWCIT